MQKSKDNKLQPFDTRWKWMAPLGLLFVGLGFSLCGEAIIYKIQEAAVWQWVAMGTAGLTCLNAGISIFGKAIIIQVKSEIINQA